MFTWLLSIPKPVISAVNGVAAGGGFVLTVMSDLRIASTDGSFTSIFSKRGLIAEHGTTWIVPRLIGAGAALDLLWSSRKIDAAEAHRIGLVQQVVEPDDLLAAARRYVVDLAENVSPASLADTKRLVYEGFGVAYPEALETIDDVQYAALDRVDAKEGAAALIEKRAAAVPATGGVMARRSTRSRYEVAGGLAPAHAQPARAHERDDEPDGARGARRARARARPTRRSACSCSPAPARRSVPAPTSSTSPAAGRTSGSRAREFKVTTLLHEIPAVTVAAINGACAGAGHGLGAGVRPAGDDRRRRS